MDLRAIRQAIVGGLKWAIARQTGEGTFEPVEFGMCGYHKMIYMLSLVGQAERATHLCSWLETNAFDEEGDFTDAHGRQGPMSAYYNYPNSWLTMGAHRLERYDISYRAMDFLTSLQHPETGGFLTTGPESALEGRQDIISTASADTSSSCTRCMMTTMALCEALLMRFCAASLNHSSAGEQASRLFSHWSVPRRLVGYVFIVSLHATPGSCGS